MKRPLDARREESAVPERPSAPGPAPPQTPPQPSLRPRRKPSRLEETAYKIRKYSRSGLSYVLGKETVHAPAHVHIETTNICNFKCVYCPQSNPDEHFQILGQGKMPLETYEKILDKLAAAYDIERIVLTRDGEPLVHPQLEDFVLYTRQKGMKITIGSNGSLITEERAARLIESGLDIMKGDFCYDKEYYEWSRAGARYEKSLRGYLNILEAARKRNADFELVLVDLYTYKCETQEEADESRARLADLFKGYEPWTYIGRAIMHNALGEAKVTFSTSERLPDKKYNRCHHPWMEMVLDYQGNVVGCCRDLRSEYQVGNVLEAGDIDKEIWNGPKMRFLRRNLRDKKPETIPTCAKCDLPYGVSYAGRSMLSKAKRFLI